MASRRNLTHQRSQVESIVSEEPSLTPAQVRIDEPDTIDTLNKETSDEANSRENTTTNKKIGRPNLSVITKGHGASGERGQLSATSIKSHLRNLISPARAHDENPGESPAPSGHGAKASFDSTFSEYDGFHSAAANSTIDEGDLSDFKDLQDEFKHAMEEGSSPWLPRPVENLKSTESMACDTSSQGLQIESREPSRDLGASAGSLRTSSRNSPNPQTSASFELDQNVKNPQKVTFIDSSEECNLELDSQGSSEEESREQAPERLRDGQNKHPPILFGNSLGLIPPSNKIRCKLAKLLLHKWAFILNYTILILLVLVLVASYSSADTNVGLNGAIAGGLLLVINVFSTLEMGAKIIAFGFWDDSQLFCARGEEYKTVYQLLGIAKFYQHLSAKYGSDFMRKIIPFNIDDDQISKQARQKQLRSSVTFVGSEQHHTDIPVHRAFARSSWNRLELVSTMSLWISLLLTVSGYNVERRIRIFTAIGTLRILKLAATQDRQSYILRSLKYGLPQLLNVGFMLLYFWVFFGILGVQSFQGSLRRQCVWTNPNNPSETYLNSFQFCGGYLEPGTGKVLPYIFKDGKKGPLAKGFICPEHSICVSDTNPYNGKVGFDNILSSMELVFVTISANTFTDIMYYTMDSDSMAASIFFIFCIFFLNIWMINLLIAVLVSSFEKANELVRKKGKDHTALSFYERVKKSVRNYLKKKEEASSLSQRALFWLKWYRKFEFIFVALIFADLVMQATLTSRSTDNAIERILNFDQATTYVLLVESIFRLLVHSSNIWIFMKNPAFVFDLLSCVVSMFITHPAIRRSLGHTYYWLNVINVVRFYRVIKMIEVTRNLWKQVLGNALLIWNLSGFYFLFLFLVSIVMAVYFEGVLDSSELDEHPFGMYTIGNAFLTLFIIGSTENWTEALYALQEHAPNSSSQFFGSILLIMWFFMANFVMLNIFIAIIAESLDVKEEEKRLLQIKHYLKHVYPERIRDFASATLVGRIRKKFFGRSQYDDSRDFKQFLFRGTAIVSIAQRYNLLNDTSEGDNQHEGLPHYIKKIKMMTRNLSIVKAFTANPFYKKPEVIYVETADSVTLNSRYTLKVNEFEEEKLQYLRDHPLYNNSYFIFPPNHILRRLCQSLCSPSVGKRTDGVRFFEDSTNTYERNSYFKHIRRDMFVTFISIATFLMVVYSCSLTPLYRIKHDLSHQKWTLYADATFVTIFSLEFIIKTVADGLVRTPNAYLRNPWNCIDVIVLFSLWIDFVAGLKQDDDLSRVFRGLTALRALRCLTISKTARSTFNQVLFDGIGKIVGAAIVSLTLLFPFAVWGLGLFRGRLGACNDGVDLSNCYNEFSNTVFDFQILTPRVYSQPYLYMNSFASAFRSLYEIVSLEGWVDMLSNSMSSTGVGSVPRTFASPENGLFFILFNFLSMVFILTLFISFIIRNHARTTGSAFYTVEEKSWLEVKKLLSQARPEPTPDVLSMGKFRSFVYKVAVEKTYFWYALFLQLMLYLHILTLLLSTYRETTSLEMYQNVLFVISTAVFLMQESLYLCGKGVRLWYAKKWDVFKFFVVLISFGLNFIELANMSTMIGFKNFRDLFQLIIFLFVIPQNDVLSELINTAMASLPSILSLTYTWGILFLVYAIAMNQIFGLTKFGPNTTGNINFRTVVKSLIVLFRCSFGEGWNYIMNDVAVNPPFCYVDEKSGRSDCGSKPYAYVMLMSWNILSMYIFLNMFVSLILESFSYLYHAGTGTKSVASREEVRKFKNAWRKFDPDGVGEIEHNLLPRLMHSFDGLLSFKIWEGRLSAKNLVQNYMKVNPSDPYDIEVDLVGLNKELESIDKKKIIERKLQYRRFIQEARHLSAFKTGIKFSKVIQQIPLYTVYSPQECLGIDEFVKRLYVMGKVDKFLENERNVEVLEMMVTRWKFIYDKRKRQGVFSKNSRTGFRRPPPIPEFTITNPEPPRTPHLGFTVNNFNWSPRKEHTQTSSNPFNYECSSLDTDGNNNAIQPDGRHDSSGSSSSGKSPTN